MNKMIKVLPKNPATIPMVVGRLAAHTPSLFSVLSSILEATTSGGAHWNQNIQHTLKIVELFNFVKYKYKNTFFFHKIIVLPPHDLWAREKYIIKN